MTIFTHIQYCLCCCGISANEIVELKIRHILNYTYTVNKAGILWGWYRQRGRESKPVSTVPPGKRCHLQLSGQLKVW